MGLIIIDGLVPERTLYAETVARLTGWKLVEYQSDDIDYYFHLGDTPTPVDVVVDGGPIRWLYGKVTNREISNTIVKLQKSGNATATVVESVESRLYQGSIDPIVKMGKFSTIIVDGNGNAIAAHPPGYTALQQDKRREIHPSFEDVYWAECQRLQEKWGR